jgi:hypothetical protein
MLTWLNPPMLAPSLRLQPAATLEDDLAGLLTEWRAAPPFWVREPATQLVPRRLWDRQVAAELHAARAAADAARAAAAGAARGPARPGGKGGRAAAPGMGVGEAGRRERLEAEEARGSGGAAAERGMAEVAVAGPAAAAAGAGQDVASEDGTGLLEVEVEVA